MTVAKWQLLRGEGMAVYIDVPEGCGQQANEDTGFDHSGALAEMEQM